MKENIAVLVGRDGQTVSFFESGIIELYEREEGEWKLIRELPFGVELAKGMKEARESLLKLASLLNGTQAVVGREITGAAYNVLNTAGFNIFEISGKPEDFLERIWEMQREGEECAEDTDCEDEIPECPVQQETEGKYYMNLKKLQLYKPEISSKKALLPFLQNETFYELEIVCGHVPPWFDTQLDKLGLKYDSLKISENEVKVTIYHKICGE